jgi:SAM-dependent methyltransferase
MTDPWQRLRRGFEILRVRRVRAKPFRCPLCGPSVLLRLDDDEIAIRCLRCGATPIAMSLAGTLRDVVPDLSAASVFELSARGPLYRFLRRRSRSLVGTQYVEGATPGSFIGGVRVEDVQRLTFADRTFDLCTATEVFEHVADDRRAFAEVLRVLKPGGALLFTVPLDPSARTRERAAIVEGTIVHLVPPEYHRDPASMAGPILSFRDYGGDIVSRLGDAGFAQAEIVLPCEPTWFGYRRPVVVAHRAAVESLRR